MTRLTWDAIGERFFEAGVDRGVLYVDGSDGVAWNGLLAVNESPTGADRKAFYLDGVKYSNRVVGEEFEATIEAYTYPDEFAQCDGTLAVNNGLFVTQQRRKSFGLAYRTRVGNDVDGLEHGFKIHLVYNATADPTSRANATVGESISPDNFSWQLSCRPPLVAGYRPTPHFVIDSRETPGALIAQVEDILYGTAEAAPRLPSVPELMYLFTIFNTSVFDAGDPAEPFYSTFDGGNPPSELQTSMIDGGMP